MQANNGRDNALRITVDRYTRLCLTAIAVLLTLVVLGLWTDLPTSLNAAAANGPGILPGSAGGNPYPTPPAPQILPDSGAQRGQMIVELKTVSARLDEIQKTLTSGKVKVMVVTAETKSEGTGDVLPPKTTK